MNVFRQINQFLKKMNYQNEYDIIGQKLRMQQTMLALVTVKYCLYVPFIKFSRGDSHIYWYCSCFIASFMKAVWAWQIYFTCIII